MSEVRARKDGLDKSEKLNYKCMPDLVKDQLMDWIMDGTIVMGEKLNAEDLANRLGISRMPVREALRNMEKSGIVVSTPYVGARVADLQVSDVAQIYIMRQALEPVAAHYACMSITDEDIAAIEWIHEKLAEEMELEHPSAKQIFVLNREFHFAIYQACNMRHLINMIGTLWDQLAFFKLIYGRKYANDKASGQKMLKEHQNYIDLLVQRKAEDIEKLFRDSLGRRVEEMKIAASDFFGTR